MRFLMKEDAGWGGSANFAVSHLVPFIDSIVRVVSRIRPALNTLTYLTCLKVLLCFDFAVYGLFIFMVNWKEVHSQPCKTSDVEVFAKLVNNWKPLIFFTKTTPS